jgi:hypothetical protein
MSNIDGFRSVLGKHPRDTPPDDALLLLVYQHLLESPSNDSDRKAVAEGHLKLYLTLRLGYCVDVRIYLDTIDITYNPTERFIRDIANDHQNELIAEVKRWSNVNFPVFTDAKIVVRTKRDQSFVTQGRFRDLLSLLRIVADYLNKINPGRAYGIHFRELNSMKVTLYDVDEDQPFVPRSPVGPDSKQADSNYIVPTHTSVPKSSQWFPMSELVHRWLLNTPPFCHDGVWKKVQSSDVSFCQDLSPSKRREMANENPLLIPDTVIQSLPRLPDGHALLGVVIFHGTARKFNSDKSDRREGKTNGKPLNRFHNMLRGPLYTSTSLAKSLTYNVGKSPKVITMFSQPCILVDMTNERQRQVAYFLYLAGATPEARYGISTIRSVLMDEADGVVLNYGAGPEIVYFNPSSDTKPVNTKISKLVFRPRNIVNKQLAKERWIKYVAEKLEDVYTSKPLADHLFTAIVCEMSTVIQLVSGDKTNGQLALENDNGKYEFKTVTEKVRLVHWEDIAPVGAEYIQPAWHSGPVDNNHIINPSMLLPSTYNGEKVVHVVFPGACYVMVAQW